MITIHNKTYTADAIHLSQVLGSTTKVNMLKVCKKFDLYVSPNLKKVETAHCVVHEVISKIKCLNLTIELPIESGTYAITGQNGSGK